MSKLPKYKMFVGGEWVAAVSGDWFESFDPYAGKPWALVARGAKDRIIRSRRRDLSV
jgi:acyl-CoA reductase-like NAD-dependent aldehyde dehydrogenase